MVGADAGLIHPGDQGRAAGRADRRGDEGMGEKRAFPGETIDVGCLDDRFPVAGEIRRHIVNDKPEDVGFGSALIVGGGRAGESGKRRGEERGEEVRGFHGV